MIGPKLSRVDMDAVAPLMPHDKTAAVVGGKGVHYEFRPTAGQAHSSEPIPFRRPTSAELNCPEYRDLTGVRIGRLTTMGVAADLKSRGNQNWVVRCVCGSYETRKGKYIKACQAGKNSGDEEPMCSWCGNTRRLQLGRHRQAEERKWRDVLGEDFPS